MLGRAVAPSDFPSSISVSMMCSQCSAARSNVVPEFGKGQYVCLSCGTVAKDRLYEDQAGPSFPVRTRLLMERLAPSAKNAGYNSWGAVSSARQGHSATQLHAATPSDAIGRTKARGVEFPHSESAHAAGSKHLSSTDAAGTRGHAVRVGLRQARKQNGNLEGMLYTLTTAVQDASMRVVNGNGLVERSAGNLLFNVAVRIKTLKGNVSKHARSLRKSNHAALAAAAVFVACRQHKCSRTVREVCQLTEVKEKKFTKALRILKDLVSGMKVRPADPEEFMRRFRSAFGWSHAVEMAAVTLVKDAISTGSLASCQPAAVAAAALHSAAAATKNKHEMESKSKRERNNRHLSKHGGASTRRSMGPPPSLKSVAKTLGLPVNPVRKASSILNAIQAKRNNKFESGKNGDFTVEDALTSSSFGDIEDSRLTPTSMRHKSISRPATPGTERALTDCEESTPLDLKGSTASSSGKPDLFINLINDLDS